MAGSTATQFIWRVKARGKKGLGRAISLLPVRLRKEMFYFLAKSVGVVGYSIPWKYGVASGSVGDEIVFRELLRFGSFAEDLIEIFRTERARTHFKSFIDIGANIGLVSIPMAAEGLTVDAFEPEPTNFRLLTQNIRQAGVDERIRTHNLALFDTAQDLEFELSSFNHGDHRIKGDSNLPMAKVDKGGRSTVIRVPGDRLDNVIREQDIEWPLACKIDTQGAEPQIYAGGRSILSKADILIIEFWPYGMRRIGGDIDALIDMLLEDFPKGGMRREGKPYHDPDARQPSARLGPKLRDMAASAAFDDWADLVLLRS